MKKDRERDATAAMKEYEAEKRAVLANTERLGPCAWQKKPVQEPAKPDQAGQGGEERFL